MDGKCKDFILNKYKKVNGPGIYYLQKIYRVIVVRNGQKMAMYDFETEEEATQCYSMLTRFNENESYLQDEEIFLTIYYNITIGV